MLGIGNNELQHQPILEVGQRLRDKTTGEIVTVESENSNRTEFLTVKLKDNSIYLVGIEGKEWMDNERFERVYE